MVSSFHTYVHSFTERKLFTTFGIDLLFWFITAILFWMLSTSILRRATFLGLTQGPEQITQILTSPQATQLATQVKSFVILSLLGLGLLLLLVLVGFSYTQMYNWHSLLKKEFSWRSCWRWAGLLIILAVPLLFYALFLSLIKYAFSSISNTDYSMLSTVIPLILWLLFLLLIYLSYYSLANVGKVWLSIGTVLSTIKSHWNSLWKMFLFVLLSAGLLQIPLFIVYKMIPYNLPALVIISLLLLLFFLAWLRVYVVKVFHQEQTI